MRFPQNKSRSINFRPRAAAAAWTGRKHLKDNQTCQDAVSTYYSTRLAVVALSDGAGSAKFSALGAQLAAQTICKTLRASFRRLGSSNADTVSLVLFKAVYNAIEHAALKKGVEVRDLACTLLFSATDGRRVLLGQLGDGIVATSNTGDKSWQRVFDLPKREYLNLTPLITGPSSHNHLQTCWTDTTKVSSVALMSDGAAESLHQRNSDTFAPALERMSEWLNKYPTKRVNAALIQALVEQLSQKTFDDVSIAFLRTGKLRRK